ncbi:response regulator [Chryseolinea lacunae]|uniref:Response regulator transcription factor n=1 Tax=Chryseolinea lacunae TaxID=2801331 RepID=A0ABS1L2Y7_9BACT|nr:response regulator transcription factor [Chryseolinea lacunae]MBL0745862.1 response regulator transcription factor [Chryseolinea lacunae]
MSSYTFSLNILIVDDHQMITDGLSQILRSEKTIDQIHMAKNGYEAIDIARTEAIDIIIMDINMPKLSGAEATKIIKAEYPAIKIIVVSMLGEAPVVNKLLKAGADAFIHKDAGKAELIKAIDKVMHNEKYVSPEISMNLFNHLNETGKTAATEKHLTKRELEIIGQISNGLTNNEIAAKLFLSSVTVDTHRKNILAKLGLKNTAALVRYAVENKLI